MRLRLLALMLLVSAPALAEDWTIAPEPLPELKAVFGRIETRDVIPARSRIGGTLSTLQVTEGDVVAAGQPIATISDDKLAIQLQAADARIRALTSERDNATTEFERARSLLDRGAATTQRVDQLRTQVDVLKNQITAAEAERAVISQQQAEGTVIAPTAGRVLRVPVKQGQVVTPGEAVAVVGGGGAFLRLALPERHAPGLKIGMAVGIEGDDGAPLQGIIAKIFPEIENGRVIVDVNVTGLDDTFIGARILVRVPVGSRPALLVPRAAVTTRSGIDFIRLNTGGRPQDVAVVLGGTVTDARGLRVEVLSGLTSGDRIMLP